MQSSLVLHYPKTPTLHGCRQDIIPQLYLDPRLDKGRAIRHRKQKRAWNSYKKFGHRCGGLFYKDAFISAIQRRDLHFFLNAMQNCKNASRFVFLPQHKANLQKPIKISTT